MIYEVIYNPIISNEFESHVKNVFPIDYDKDCFVFFYLGEDASKYLNEQMPNLAAAHLYIRELEKKFKVNINWIDISAVFDAFKLQPSKDDVLRVLYYLKRLHFNSIEQYIANK
jgi:hypothetical protein